MHFKFDKLLSFALSLSKGRCHLLSRVLLITQTIADIRIDSFPFKRVLKRVSLPTDIELLTDKEVCYYEIDSYEVNWY